MRFCGTCDLQWGVGAHRIPAPRMHSETTRRAVLCEQTRLSEKGY